MSTLNQPNRKAVMDAWATVHTDTKNQLGRNIAPLHQVIDGLTELGSTPTTISDAETLFTDMLSASRGDQYASVPTAVVNRSQSAASRITTELSAMP